MSDKTRGQLVGFFGAWAIVGLAMTAWFAAGGHVILARPADATHEAILLAFPKAEL